MILWSIPCLMTLQPCYIPVSCPSVSSRLACMAVHCPKPYMNPLPVTSVIVIVLSLSIKHVGEVLSIGWTIKEAILKQIWFIDDQFDGFPQDPLQLSWLKFLLRTDTFVDWPCRPAAFSCGYTADNILKMQVVSYYILQYVARMVCLLWWVLPEQWRSPN